MAQKTVKSYRQLLELVRDLNAEQAPKGSKKEAKLLKIAQKVKVHFEVYNEKREDLRLDHAHVNKDGALDLNQDGGFKFTKDGLKELNKNLKSLLDETFEFYQFTFSVEEISELSFLAGWVEGIKEEETNEEV
jgi:hypothetical protein